MKNISKGVIASVCLTGSLTIETSETERGQVSGPLMMANHYIDFGFSRAMADDSSDGDRRQECFDLAATNFDTCMQDANYDENWLVAAWIELNCRISWVDHQKMCSNIGFGY